MGKCPNCGAGALFRSYLKQVDHCAVCGESYGKIHADDGPPWLTIKPCVFVSTIGLWLADPSNCRMSPVARKRIWSEYR